MLHDADTDDSPETASVSDVVHSSESRRRDTSSIEHHGPGLVGTVEHLGGSNAFSAHVGRF